MGNTSSRTEIGTYGLSAQIADAVTDIFGQLRALFSKGFPARDQAATNRLSLHARVQNVMETLRWGRADAPPRLRFDVATPPTSEVDETTTLEDSPWAIFDEVSATATRQALRIEDLQTSATNCLDAADYALQRLKQELSAVAPDLIRALHVTSLPLERTQMAFPPVAVPHRSEPGIAA